METDINLLTRQWIDNGITVGPVVKFIRGPHQLSTFYRTTHASFTIIRRGHGVLLADRQSFDMKPGKVIHSASNIWLKAWNTDDTEFECYRVLYLPNSPEYAGNEYMYKQFALSIIDHPRIRSLLDRMCGLSNHNDVQSELQMKTLFYLWLNELLITTRNLQDNEQQRMIDESIAYIQQNVHEPHSLFSLASRYGLSSKYFAELFFKFSGSSPINYLIRYRMNMAEQLLRTTNASIREIGRAVGYNDPYQFSKMFKKHVGITPSDIKSANGSI